MAGAVAADGVEVVVGDGAVEDLGAFDPGLLDVGVDAEGVAAQDDEVGVFAGVEGADTVAKVEHLGAAECEGARRAPGAGHAGRGRPGRRSRMKRRESVIQSSV